MGKDSLKKVQNPFLTDEQIQSIVLDGISILPLSKRHQQQ
jgi:hypothetical protein